jgi:hypothetical protein
MTCNRADFFLSAARFSEPARSCLTQTVCAAVVQTGGITLRPEPVAEAGCRKGLSKLCLRMARSSDWAWVAWIVPIWEASAISGYALFLCSPDADHYPELFGVYESLAEAQKALASEGAVDGADDPLVRPSNG